MVAAAVGDEKATACGGHFVEVGEETSSERPNQGHRTPYRTDGLLRGSAGSMCEPAEPVNSILGSLPPDP